MGRHVKCGSVLLLSMCVYTLTLSAATAAWTIEALKVKPYTDTGEGELTAVAVGQAGGGRVELSARIPVEIVDDWFVTGDKLVLLGEASRTQAVVIFDIRQRKPIDWFVCYSPQRISEQWIVFVEFYFANVAGGEPTDVVLVYDLTKTPLENRLERTPGMMLPPGHLDTAFVRAGVPVLQERRH